ncbi:Carbam_trans_N domain-containing protein [Durusdinium trenchii]|uniref:Carbam_trans_N domain-containing protein n=1 Tax=Durusdinium trenchii TaxID=1381693 RepID=A0ABP0SMZ7_9DINO
MALVALSKANSANKSTQPSLQTKALMCVCMVFVQRVDKLHREAWREFPYVEEADTPTEHSHSDVFYQPTFASFEAAVSSEGVDVAGTVLRNNVFDGNSLLEGPNEVMVVMGTGHGISHIKVGAPPGQASFTSLTSTTTLPTNIWRRVSRAVPPDQEPSCDDTLAFMGFMPQPNTGGGGMASDADFPMDLCVPLLIDNRTHQNRRFHNLNAPSVCFVDLCSPPIAQASPASPGGAVQASVPPDEADSEVICFEDFRSASSSCPPTELDSETNSSMESPLPAPLFGCSCIGHFGVCVCGWLRRVERHPHEPQTHRLLDFAPSPLEATRDFSGAFEADSVPEDFAPPANANSAPEMASGNPNMCVQSLPAMSPLRHVSASSPRSYGLLSMVPPMEVAPHTMSSRVEDDPIEDFDDLPGDAGHTPAMASLDSPDDGAGRSASSSLPSIWGGMLASDSTPLATLGDSILAALLECGVPQALAQQAAAKFPTDLNAALDWVTESDRRHTCPRRSESSAPVPPAPSSWLSRINATPGVYLDLCTPSPQRPSPAPVEDEPAQSVALPPVPTSWVLPHQLLTVSQRASQYWASAREDALKAANHLYQQELLWASQPDRDLASRLVDGFLSLPAAPPQHFSSFGLTFDDLYSEELRLFHLRTSELADKALTVADACSIPFDVVGLCPFPLAVACILSSAADIATDADLASRMMETEGKLFWASPECWLMLDTAHAKRFVDASKDKINFNLLECQNGNDYGPRSIKSCPQQIHVPTTNFGMLLLGQADCVHDFWGHAFSPGSPVRSKGFEGRPMFLFAGPARLLHQEQLISAETIYGFMKILLLNIARTVGHNVNTNFVDQPLQPANPMWWRQLKSAGLEAEEEAPACSQLAAAKWGYTCGAHIITNQLFLSSFASLPKNHVDLKRFLDGEEQGLVVQPPAPTAVPSSWQQLSDHAFLAAPRALSTFMSSLSIIYAEMQLPVEQRAGTKVVAAPGARPQAPPSFEHALSKALQRHRNKQHLHFNDIQTHINSKCRNQATYLQVFQLAADVGVGQLEGTGTRSDPYRLKLTLSNLSQANRARFGLEAELDHLPPMQGGGKRAQQASQPPKKKNKPGADWRQLEREYGLVNGLQEVNLLHACRQYHADLHFGEDLAMKSIFHHADRVADWAHLIGACARSKTHVTKEEGALAWRAGIFSTVEKDLSPFGKRLLPLVKRTIFCLRSVPTAIIFHTITDLLFRTLLAQEPPERKAVSKMQRFYFAKVPAAAARIRFELKGWPGDPSFLFSADWWCGIQRIQPGSASGIQAQESWHKRKLKAYLSLRSDLPTFCKSLEGFTRSRLHELRAHDCPLPDVPREPFPDKTVLHDSVKLTAAGSPIQKWALPLMGLLKSLLLSSSLTHRLP